MISKWYISSCTFSTGVGKDVLDDVPRMLDFQFKFSSKLSLSPTSVNPMNTNGITIYRVVIVWGNVVRGIDSYALKCL